MVRRLSMIVFVVVSLSTVALANPEGTPAEDGLEKGIEHFREYLRENPDAANAGALRELIITLEEDRYVDDQLGDEESVERPRWDTPRFTPGDTPPQRAGSPGTATHDVRDPGLTKRVTGAIVGTAGLAMLATAVLFENSARDKEQRLNDLPPGTIWDVDLIEAYDEGQRDHDRAVKLAIAGGVSVAVGGVLYYLGVRDVEVAVNPSASGSTVSAAWSF
jgi:hypothetical protein